MVYCEMRKTFISVKDVNKDIHVHASIPACTYLKENIKLLNMKTLEADCCRREDSSLVYTSNLYVTNIFDRVPGTANICQ